MGWTISHIWHLVGRDVEQTVHQVAQRLLDDDSADEETKHCRALALYEVSCIFSVRYPKLPAFFAVL
jgi:hypothetical protein